MGHDGMVVEVEVTEQQTGVQLKQALLDDLWPEKLEKVETTDSIRFICMGKILPDNKTVKDMKIQRNAYPTPVNVALRPKDVPLVPKKAGAAAKVAEDGTTVSNGCSCVLM